MSIKSNDSAVTPAGKLGYYDQGEYSSSSFKHDTADGHKIGFLEAFSPNFNISEGQNENKVLKSAIFFHPLVYVA